jgi:hypothetical protein
MKPESPDLLRLREINETTKRFQVVIERCVVYEVDAFDEKDAEDLAWGMFSADDLNEPFVAEVAEV